MQAHTDSILYPFVRMECEVKSSRKVLKMIDGRRISLTFLREDSLHDKIHRQRTSVELQYYNIYFKNHHTTSMYV